MNSKVKYSGTAIRDLERVWAEVFEASNDYDVTGKYIDDLMNKVEAKADYPHSGTPLYYENGFTGYYFVVFKAYIVFYRIEKDVILVDRVLFAKCDYIRSLHLSSEDV